MNISYRPAKKSFLTVSALVAVAIVVFVPGIFRWHDPESVASSEAGPILAAQIHHSQTSKAVVQLVNSFHYRNRPLDNEFSSEILNEYLNALDPNHSYFRSTDIQQFNSYRFYMDDFLRSGKLDTIFEIFKVFKTRVAERASFAKTLLEGSFDFGLDEELPLDGSQVDWPFNQAEHDSLWRRIVKNEFLKLKLAGTEDNEITETLKQRYERYSQVISLTNSNDVFETFVNSYLRSIEPHSEYFSPHSSKNLAISLTSQIEGIGAMLRLDNDHTIIHSVIPGGPAARSNDIHPGDTIVAVSQDEGQGFVDIVGWRLNDVVDEIRGPRGTSIILKIIPEDSLPDAKPEVVTLVRDKVKIEDQIAKKSAVEISTDHEILRIGIISLPSFYSGLAVDGESRSNQDSVSSSKDVKRILEELIDRHVDGVILDLRGNGGGALQEAVKVTGLFIKSGPIVQVRTTTSDAEVIRDEDSRIVYDGPLVVLVDRRSASASEIVAAAIKDYRRGIVVGETTFGKGGIQTVWPLSEVTKLDESGNVKLTTAQYYRIDGPSTQHVGVAPDILYPTNDFVKYTGERALDHALPESVIAPTDIRQWRDADLVDAVRPAIRRLHQVRAGANPIFTYLANEEQILRERSKETEVSLNESRRRESQQEFKDRLLVNVNQLRQALGLESVDEFHDDAFPRDVAGDPFLDESLNIIADLITETRAMASSNQFSTGARSS